MIKLIAAGILSIVFSFLAVSTYVSAQTATPSPTTSPTTTVTPTPTRTVPSGSPATGFGG